MIYEWCNLWRVLRIIAYDPNSFDDIDKDLPN